MRPIAFFILAGVLVWFAARGLISSDAPAGPPPETDGDVVNMEVLGCHLFSEWVSAVVVLGETDGPRILRIYIGNEEARAIIRRLNGDEMPRPMTHDLLGQTVEALGGSVRQIVVTSLEDGTFYARVDFDSSSDTVSLDARPSDAIALAIRAECPILVHRTVMDEAGEEPMTGPDVDFAHVGCGIWCQPLDPELGSALGVEVGVVVADLSLGQEREGTLERGDVILDVGGQPADEVSRVQDLLRALEDGDPLPLRIMRGGRELEVEMTCR